MNGAIAGKVRFNIFLGLLPRNGNIAGQPKITDAVNDAKIDGLGVRPLFRRNFRQGNAKDFRRRTAVNVLSLLKAIDHGRILG